ncbi:MAG TPA: hypothetical protein VMT47_18695 [Polyangia bacterium]|nr:hypothetical protein [Polyangia bacterium]
MDFMFEDEVDEVGSDVEAYCPKCKGDTTHVVISKYEDEIRRVQCNPCGDVHSFRKPRGDVEDDVPEPIAAKKRAMLKKHSWEEFFAKHSEKNAKPYEFRERYSENAIVTHPKFGKGFVTEVMSDSKVEITFKDSRRVLVHNRKDMPGLPLAAEGDGRPSNAKVSGAKGAKGKAAAAAPAKPVTAKAAKETPKPLVKESAAVAVAKNAKNRAKVPPAKTSPAAKAGAEKRTASPPRAVRPVASAKKKSSMKSSKPAKAAKPVKKAKGKK